MYPREIKNVAIYLRKSREEEGEKDSLKKHRTQLIEFVNNKGWTFQTFEEIGTSQDIEYREQFKRLLELVEMGIYDAVVCMDFDRITRAGMSDYATIQKSFAKNHTLIITPYEYTDLSDEENIMNPMKAVMGNYEYIQIKKRLREGKLRNARMGRWVNGKPPYGYGYDRNTKKLFVNEEEAKVVRLIYDWYLDEMAMYEIGHELNKRGHKTATGSYFQDATISRILTNRVYIGDNVFGKSEGSGHLKKKSKDLRKIDESEWIIIPDCHPPLVSKEDFEKVKTRTKKRTRVPTKARSGKYPLSGLFFCGKCGKSMRFNKKKLKSRGLVTYVVKCQKSDPFGNRCGNQGIEANVVLEEIEQRINHKMNEIETSFGDESKDSLERIEWQTESIKLEINKLENGMDRIKELYIEGMIDKAERQARTDKQTKSIDKAKGELHLLEEQYKEVSNQSKKERLERFEQFKKNFSLTDNEETINKNLKEIVKRLDYTRNGNSFQLEITYM